MSDLPIRLKTAKHCVEGGCKNWKLLDEAADRIEALQQQVENELAAREEAEQDADRLQEQVESLDGALAVAVRWANKRTDRHLQSSRSTGEGQ
jgi:hypothetical protein